MTKTIKALVGIGAIAFLTTGCATKSWYNDPITCAIAGAAAGGVATYQQDEDYAYAGALGGAIVGATVCALLHTDGDVDGDGVSDSEDQCPSSTLGAEVDALGCELDADGDGVVDAKDQCPMTPAGTEVDVNGCALDTDGDGYADYKDHCPNSPEGAEVNKLGCVNDLVLNDVNFAFDSAEMTEAGKAALEDDIARLKYRDDGDLITIEGHTDSIGSAE
ncbi:MAG TPA: OmpA family protein, partial [Methylophaga sp.]|nr:OmpA family protein [Methylophaga sp.]